MVKRSDEWHAARAKMRKSASAIPAVPHETHGGTNPLPDNSRILKNYFCMALIEEIRNHGVEPDPWLSAQISVTLEPATPERQMHTVMWWEHNDGVVHVDIQADLFGKDFDKLDQKIPQAAAMIAGHIFNNMKSNCLK